MNSKAAEIEKLIDLQKKDERYPMVPRQRKIITIDPDELVYLADELTAKRCRHEPITWGEPAKIAASKEVYRCGICSARRGVYGRDYGRAPTGTPLGVDANAAFDIKTKRGRIEAALCWNCEFAY